MANAPPPLPSPLRYAIAGTLVLAVCLVGTGAWALRAPLASAIIAPGVVAVEGNRKVIQHLEGGIVDRIAVQEAQAVETGDILLELSPVAAVGGLKMLEARLLAARATEARLLAEQSGQDQFYLDFPHSLPQALLEEAIKAEQLIFEDRRTVLASQIALLRNRMDQIDEQVFGLESRKRALATQEQLLSDEVERLRGGAADGAIAKNHLAAMERELASIQGDVGAVLAEGARASQLLAETELEIVQLGHQFRERAASELKDVRSERNQLQLQVDIAADAAKRTIIRSPIDGIVQNLAVHTSGGVLRAGDPAMEIVPVDDTLVVNARIRPIDIDSVRLGAVAEVRFSAFQLKDMPIIKGTVAFASPDILEDNQSGETFYLARIVVDARSYPPEEHLQLLPGMPAEVLIPVHERSVFEYLTEPILHAVRTGMREQ
ncbi:MULTISPECIES: HlyD family type I secretion periplasmic adaptor subunit [Devosia]|uniref:HlyD family type I secretion periplasmic adaptor subunit n=1 Tax=Devosia TaxID=46913 RepID=UPI001300BAFF|nr:MULTISPECIES: HlyD family type I secretion periplasmic adaptor subunit [Devosia]